MNTRHNNFLSDYQVQMGLSDLDMAVHVYKERQKVLATQDKDGKWTDAKNPPKMWFRPLGIVSKGGIWYPSPKECRSCCSKIAEASFKFPWAYKRHCKTATHIAELFLVDEGELLTRVARKRKPTRKCAQCAKFCSQADHFCPRCREIADAVDRAFPPA